MSVGFCWSGCAIRAKSVCRRYNPAGGGDRGGHALLRAATRSRVRFIELSHPGWDQHQNLKTQLTNNCNAIDKPMAALIQDLKQRDMLKDTLLVWGGEFGRTPTSQNGNGRDHNAGGYSMWMAGGGVKGGMRYGATDDHGTKAVSDEMHVHDLHATILHLLGLDHEKLTYRYSGRDFRLSGSFRKSGEEDYRLTLCH